MLSVKRAVTITMSVLLLGTMAACAEQPTAPQGESVSALDANPAAGSVLASVLTVSISGDSYTCCRGDELAWTATATGGTGTYTYQWQYRSASSSTWSNVGTGASTYSRLAPLNPFYVRVIVTSGSETVTSNPFYVYVEPY